MDLSAVRKSADSLNDGVARLEILKEKERHIEETVRITRSCDGSSCTVEQPKGFLNFMGVQVKKFEIMFEQDYHLLLPKIHFRGWGAMSFW